MSTVFDKMISNLMTKDTPDLIHECMSLKPGVKGQIPFRYRAIAYAFVANLSLDQLNDQLTSHGEDRLYARSPIEGTLIYALTHHLPYAEWKELQAGWQTIYEESAATASLQGELTPNSLQAYVHMGVDPLTEARHTQTLKTAKTATLFSGSATMRLEYHLAQIPGGQAALLAYLTENVLTFSNVRERTRYYFCKYLGLYLEQQIADAAKWWKTEYADRHLPSVLKGARALPRTLTKEALCEQLRSLPISCGALFDEFNLFYFEYISVDWLEAMLEDMNKDLSVLWGDEKKRVANCLRTYYPQWKSLSDDRILEEKRRLDVEEERRLDAMTEKDFYQRGRSGENSIRSYLKGALDIDRASLLFYLIFFSSELPSVHPDKVNRECLDKILKHCGFAALDPSQEDSLDAFVCGLLGASDLAMYLHESIVESAAKQENSPLFKLYSRSVSSSQKAHSILL